MTDSFDDSAYLPTRLGVIAEVVEGELRLRLDSHDEVLRHGLMRASVASLMIDLAAGFVLDDNPKNWVMTTDLSVRMRPSPAPDSTSTRCTIIRQGGRSGTAIVDLVTNGGEPVATGAITFARVPRRQIGVMEFENSAERITTMFGGSQILTGPLPDEAGIVVLDPARGRVQMPVTSALRNPNGAVQGAIVALIAEVAAEVSTSARFEAPAVVTDLDLRYLAQTDEGPLETRCSVLGEGPDAPLQVEIIDRSNERLTTLAYARSAILTS